VIGFVRMRRRKPPGSREPLIAEDARQALGLRLHRLTSPTICRRMLAEKHPALSEEAQARKSEGIASAIRSALGYWESSPSALNAKILSHYYFALQLSIAEEIANANPQSTLESIQRYTEQGHGLATIRNPDLNFPENYYVAVLKSGHFSSYCSSLGIDLDPIALDARPRGWPKVLAEDKSKLVTLTDLLRRVPELRALTHECLGVPPLSFHIVRSGKNMEFDARRMAEGFRPDRNSDLAAAKPAPPASVTTYLSIATGFGGAGQRA
jgi:hypothetical protein